MRGFHDFYTQTVIKKEEKCSLADVYKNSPFFWMF